MASPVSTDSLIGTTVSQYEILSKLGGGGMGVVYKARDTKLGRLVALKFLPPQWSHDESAKQRFVREAQAASATNHRNICVIHNIDETRDGRLFIVMAYYEGETLKQRLERGPLPIADAVEIASEIADGLAKAHAQGVIHRDVKPGNLIITEDGVKILDFGLAKFADALQLTVPGSTIGTVAYMSPEQARGEEADARSDVWSLGIVMYEMLTGSVPFRGTYQEATFHAIKHEPLPSLRAARPDLPEALERIVLKALEKDPAKRFQSAREPARDLKLLLGRTVPVDLQTVEVVRPVGVDAASLPKRSRRVLTATRLAAAAALLASIAAVSYGAYYWMHRQVERIRVAVIPIANHTGNTEIDPYRLALTSVLIDELADSPNIRVVPYLRLVEMIRPFTGSNADVSSNDAVRAVATASGVPFLVVPTLEYRDQNATWILRTEIRNAQTGTSVATYETAPLTSTLPTQTAFRLSVAGAEAIQQHFESNGPGRTFRARPVLTRFHDAGAARAFVEGMNKYDELEYAAALPALTNAVALDDQHAMSHAWLSRVYLILSRKNDAIASALRAKALVTSETPRLEAAFIAGVAAESQGELDSAENSYREMVAAQPDDLFARFELADFLKRRQNKNQPAIDAYQELLKLDPSYIRPHVELCQLYTRIDERALAEQEAQSAITRYHTLELPGGEAQAYLCLGEAQRQQGKTRVDEARRNIERARVLIEQLDEPYSLSRAVFYQGAVEYSARRLDDAERFFSEAVTRCDVVGNRLTQGIALMNLGVINYYLGRPTPAVDFYRRSREVYLQLGDERRVAEIDVDVAGLQIDYGNNPVEVVRTLRNARANLEKMGHSEFQLSAMQNEADTLRYAGRVEEARMMLRSALQIAREKQLPNVIRGVRLSLALTDTQANDYEAARAALQELVDQDANDEDARIALGVVLTKLGDLTGAKVQLDQALAVATDQQLGRLLPAVHAALGELAYEAKQPSIALTHFDAAIESWVDPMSNPSSTQARCDRGLQESLLGRSGRQDLDRGVAEAQRSRRLPLETQCRAQLARVRVLEHRFGEALAALREVPEDTGGVTLGPELRAQVDFWRGQAKGADSDGSRLASDAQKRVQGLRDSLPPAFRELFDSRADIVAILSPSDVRSHQ